MTKQNLTKIKMQPHTLPFQFTSASNTTQNVVTTKLYIFFFKKTPVNFKEEGVEGVDELWGHSEAIFMTISKTYRFHL